MEGTSKVPSIFRSAFHLGFGKKRRACIEGSNRVIRGGSWNNTAEKCRVAFRNRNNPDNRNHNVGFRLVFVP